jgi:hypothetical protein
MNGSGMKIKSKISWGNTKELRRGRSSPEKEAVVGTSGIANLLGGN